MIRLASATFSLIFLMGSFGMAQEAVPKVQVFGGYSLFHADSGGLNGTVVDLDLRQFPNTFELKTYFSGWSAEAQYNLDRWFGVVVDVGGRYGTPFTSSGANAVTGVPNGSTYSILAGPVISYRAKKKITPFLHGLFGWDRTSLSASTLGGASPPVSSVATTYDDFVMAAGGGVDYKMTRRFSIRVAQLEWYHTSLNLNSFYQSAFGVTTFQGLSTHERNYRLSTGVVVKF